MVRRRPAKIRFQEWKKINRKIERRDREMARYLDDAEVFIVEHAPRDRESLSAMLRANTRANGRASGIVAFFRHKLTNYEEIIEGMKSRWPGHSPPWHAKERLRLRISIMSSDYLRSIGAADLKQPVKFKRF